MTETLLETGDDAMVSNQFRIELVQILNWGGYAGLHEMPVGHQGTAILGPTGMGKSTILDAMAAVIMPNPQEFNRAARDDGGKKAERTVYSYARGKTDDVKDATSQATTTQYLRPVGTAFPTGAAITWRSDLGEQVTAVRIAWVGADTSTQEELNSATVYLLVEGEFGLSRLSEVEPSRGARSPLTESALRQLADGPHDLVTSSQPTLRARFCRRLGIGGSEESQLKALTLLRRAQASKGIFSISDLFKEFVLNEPLALSRWETTLSAYREASALYDVFEVARKRLEILADVPVQAERYSAAMEAATEKRKLHLTSDDAPHSRLDLWHAERIEKWAVEKVELNRVARAETERERAAAATEARAAQQRWESAADQIVALGGDRSTLVRTQLDAARAASERVESDRRSFGGRLAQVGLGLPDTAEQMDDLLATMAEKREQFVLERTLDTEQTQQLAARVVDLNQQLTRRQRDLDSFRRRRSNVPEDADARRRSIAAGAGVPVESLRYLGELVEVEHEHRGWSVAIERVLGATARQLLVDVDDFAAVRRHVNENDMRGSITLVPAQTGTTARRRPIPGTVPAMLRFDTASPFHGWLVDELVDDASVLCVERTEDLDASRPASVKGAVTRQGMRTLGRNRVTKDDRRGIASWIGLDNSMRVTEITGEIEDLTRRIEAAKRAYDTHQHGTEDRRRQIDLLADLEQTDWRSIDLDPHRERIRALESELAAFATDEPAITELTRAMEAHAEARARAEARAETCQVKLRDLDRIWGELVEAEDAARDVIAETDPLTQAERVFLGQLAFTAPHEAKDVERSRRAALDALREQAATHDLQVEQGELLLVRTFERYLDYDPGAEFDASIDSLPAVLEVHRTLLGDDLPRAKSDWLAKAGASMTESLRSLLTQISDDAHVIRRGIRPINEVLAGIEFRRSSTLEIEAVLSENGDLREFRRVLGKHTKVDPDAPEDAVADEATIEKRFLALRRDLARLDEQTRAGEAWRHRVLDAREHVQFRAVEHREDGAQVVHTGVGGKSGGEGQELIAFVLGAALRYRLGHGADHRPSYAPVVLDEGFVKADTEYTGRALAALRGLGFQLIIGAPRDKVTAFEAHVDSVAYINRDPNRVGGVRIYPLTIAEAVALGQVDSV